VINEFFFQLQVLFLGPVTMSSREKIELDAGNDTQHLTVS
jgi:hypothetical protein